MNHAVINLSHSMVLVTGANSLLGTHIIERLLSEGYQVKGLLRNKNRFYLPSHPKLTLIEGDFTDARTIENALQDCEFVIHVAACTDQGISVYDHYHKINVAATQQLSLLASESGVKRFVYVSTANCFGFGSKEYPGNETCPSREPLTDSDYARSKLEAQKILLSAEHDMKIVIVNPTFMLGTYDSKPSSGRIILMAYGRKIVCCPPGGKNFINAADAAAGVIRALLYGKHKETYLLAGENLSYREFYQKMAEVTGTKHRYIIFPKVLLLAIGLLGNLLKRLKIRNQFTLTNMKILCIGNYYANHKAITELGLKIQPIERGISNAIEWFKTQGIIKKSFINR